MHLHSAIKVPFQLAQTNRCFQVSEVHSNRVKVHLCFVCLCRQI